MVIHVGIAGMGKMGNVYFSELQKRSDFLVTSVYDVDKQRVRMSPRGVHKYSTLSSFCNQDFDLGIVTSPTGTHASIAVELYEHGKHVLVEKPLDKTLEQADRILLSAKHYHKPVMVGFVEYFNPVYDLVVKNLPTIGSLEKIIIKRKRTPLEPTRQVGSNVLLDCLVHDMYNLISLFPNHFASVKIVSAEEWKTGNVHMPYLDEGKGMLHADNIAISFEASWASPHVERTTTFIGSRGKLVVNYVARSVTLHFSTHNTQVTAPIIQSPISLILDAVQQTMLHDVPFPIDPQYARRALEICIQIEQTAKNK